MTTARYSTPAARGHPLTASLPPLLPATVHLDAVGLRLAAVGGQRLPLHQGQPLRVPEREPHQPAGCADWGWPLGHWQEGPGLSPLLQRASSLKAMLAARRQQRQLQQRQQCGLAWQRWPAAPRRARTGPWARPGRPPQAATVMPAGSARLLHPHSRQASARTPTVAPRLLPLIPLPPAPRLLRCAPASARHPRKRQGAGRQVRAGHAGAGGQVAGLPQGGRRAQQGQRHHVPPVWVRAAVGATSA